MDFRIIREIIMAVMVLMFMDLCCLSLAAAEENDSWINYDKFNQRIKIDTLRGGIHDPDGENEYVFKVELLGKKKGGNEKDDQDKKIQMDIGQIGEIKVEALKLWKMSEADKGAEIQINGDQIRSVVTRVMNTFSLKENEVEVMVRITITEKNKKYFFFGDDILVGEISYFPLNLASGELGDEEGGKALKTFRDEKGIFVSFNIEYLKPATEKEKDKKPASDEKK